MTENKSLSIILPIYNEQDNIRKTIGHSFEYLLKQSVFTLFEVIVVNDGSHDQTAEILNDIKGKHKDLVIVTHPKNLGYGTALLSGVKKAKFDWVLLMDADGQFQISSMAKAIEYMPDYDIITGYRFKRQDSVYRIILGKCYTILACLIFGLNLKDINCGFKFINCKKINFKGISAHAGAFYTNFYIKAKAMGCRIKEFPVEHFRRNSGRGTGANLDVILASMKDVINLRFRNLK